MNCAKCGKPQFNVGPVCTRCKEPTARDLTEKGIAESAAHAEQVASGWKERALAFFKLYATLHPTLMTENVRAYAYERGLDRPPAEGAWGSVTRKAMTEGYVRKVGFKTSDNASQHGKPMALFASEIFVSGATHVE